MPSLFPVFIWRLLLLPFRTFTIAVWRIDFFTVGNLEYFPCLCPLEHFTDRLISPSAWGGASACYADSRFENTSWMMHWLWIWNRVLSSRVQTQHVVAHFGPLWRRKFFTPPNNGWPTNSSQGLLAFLPLVWMEMSRRPWENRIKCRQWWGVRRWLLAMWLGIWGHFCRVAIEQESWSLWGSVVPESLG